MLPSTFNRFIQNEISARFRIAKLEGFSIAARGALYLINTGERAARKIASLGAVSALVLGFGAGSSVQGAIVANPQSDKSGSDDPAVAKTLRDFRQTQTASAGSNSTGEQQTNSKLTRYACSGCAVTGIRG
jgi:hypothetical protein